MDKNQIIQDLGEDWSGYRNIMVSTLFNENPLINTINNYLINDSGKEIRPALALLAAGVCGKRNQAVLYCAAVSQMIHTATLLHDDVADNGDIRRGKPTVRALFTSAASVLSGDYWLAKALYLLCTKCGVKILECYTTAVEELAEGELIQMNLSESLAMTEEIYYDIISKKTSSLFIAAIKGAATAMEAPSDTIESLTKYGLYLGQAFQIRDDIFDYTPSLHTGKAAGADIKERKITLPLILALKHAPSQKRDLIMAKIREQSEDVATSALDFVAEYRGVALAQEELLKRAALAKESLTALPQSKEKGYLLSIVDYLVSRTQ